MASSNFLSKLNWRLILVHFFACWFLMIGVRQLAYLYDYDFLNNFILANTKFFRSNKFNDINFKGLDPDRLSMDMFHAEMTGFVSIFIAAIISFLISSKHKWHWINVIIIFLLSVVAWRFDKFYWHYIKPILFEFGSLFKSNWVYGFVNGLLMLSIGSLLFFLKPIINFISHNKADI